MGHTTDCTLIVEDDLALSRAIAAEVTATWPAANVHSAPTLRAAEDALSSGTTLVLIDVNLPDGQGTALLPKCAQLARPPAVVAMSGAVSTAEAFGLAVLGIRAFLAKPIDPDELTSVIDGIEASPLVPVEAARGLVGVASIHEVQVSVKRAMLEQALFITGWNRTAAARVLQVSRQAVQQMIRDLELEPHNGRPTSV